VAEQVKIEVNVPRDGLMHYEFLGASYVHNEAVPDRRQSWPVARGIPLPQGAVHDVRSLVLRDAEGRLVPRQVRSLATWPDGSVMFAHVAWQCNVAHDAPASFTLELVGGPESPAPTSPVVIREMADRVTVDTGPLQATIRRDTEAPHLSLAFCGRRVFNGEVELWTIDGNGVQHQGRLDGPEAVRVVESGPLVGIVEIAGQHKNSSGADFLDYVLRLRFDAGRADLRVSHTFVHLGDEPESTPVGEVALRLPPVMTGDMQHVVRQSHAGENTFCRYAEFPEDVDILVDSAGVRIADTAPLREDTSGYPSYLLKCKDLVDHWIGLRTDAWTMLTFIHEAQENWPKRLLARSGRLEYDLWPKGADVQELRQGMARTHHIQLSFFGPDAPAGDLHVHARQVDAPANAVVPFSWHQRCQVFGMQHVMPWLPKRYPLVEGAFLGIVERGWATGMLNYGDDPDRGYSASYAASGITTDTVWINNEHDFMSQAVIQYWRTGRSAAWKSARVCAEHQIDVDLVRKSANRWKQGGIPAHCHLHTTAAAYPSHMWTEGLLQYYLTSGDDRALEAAKSIGRLLCQYVEERYQALATESRMEGWTLIALAALIEVTHDERCLRAAQKIERRVREVIGRTGSYDREGLTYGTGTVLTGLGNLHRVTGNDDTLKLLLEILDWHLEHGRNAVGIAWCDQLRPYSLNLTLPAYAYAYHATGDKKYLDAGNEFLAFTGPPAVNTSVRGGGKLYRTFVPYLKVAHESDVLEQLEQRMR